MTIDKKYITQFLKTTQMAAFKASLYKGKNDKIAADKAAVDIMREELNNINFKGKVVIGEGELDEAPMLYIGEKLGTGEGKELDIAVDPVEGTNFVAKNLPNAISVLAISEKGGLLHAPETYMDKIAIGPNLPKNLIDLDNDIEKNVSILAKIKNKNVSDLAACVLDRPRHARIIEHLKLLKVKCKLISDGDVCGALMVANPKNKIDLFLGIGGGPEGIIAAAALSCFNCQMQTRLIFQNDNEKKRAKEMGIIDLNKKYNIDEMISNDVIFCATGITDGDLVSGIKVNKSTFSSETYVTHKSSNYFEIIKEDIAI